MWPVEVIEMLRLKSAARQHWPDPPEERQDEKFSIGTGTRCGARGPVPSGSGPPWQYAAPSAANTYVSLKHLANRRET